ncbi:MAG: rhodanese-like domain-containing protein [Acidobacteriota bacterium]|nr:rhodanese-like domain-containing protein [Acidobacteriota bacterium]
MRYLLSLLLVAMLGTAVFTACNSAAQQSNRQQAQNTNSTAGANQTGNTAAGHSSDDGHGHSEDKTARITIADAKKAFDGGNAVFVDTRAASSYESNHIKGALNIPSDQFQTRYTELPRDKQIITYCS